MLWVLMKTKQSSQVLSLSVDGLQCRLKNKLNLAEPPWILDSVLSHSGLPLQAGLLCFPYEALCNNC